MSPVGNYLVTVTYTFLGHSGDIQSVTYAAQPEQNCIFSSLSWYEYTGEDVLMHQETSISWIWHSKVMHIV